MKTLFLLATLATPCAFAQKSVGVKFGAPDPRTCSSRKANGAPTAAQLAQFFICDTEKMTPSTVSGDLLYLVGNLNLQVGKGRPFNVNTDSWSDVDPSQTVYPIRGNYTEWQCLEPDPHPIGNAPRAGKNCFKYDAPGATGVCYKDTFGDWHCKFCCATVGSGQGGVEFFPPPSANR